MGHPEKCAAEPRKEGSPALHVRCLGTARWAGPWDTATSRQCLGEPRPCSKQHLRAVLGTVVAGHQLASPGKSPAWTLGFLRCPGQAYLPSHKGRSAQAWLWPSSGFIFPT